MKNSTLLFAILLFSQLISAQTTFINENFNSGNLPSGWTNNAINGTLSWQFGLDGTSAETGNNNLDSTSFAFFDDDAAGNGANNSVELISPSFDNSNDSVTLLEFDYNFRQISNPGNIPDSFFVDVYNGTIWNRVFSTQNTDDCGRYNLGLCLNGFPHATIDISAFKNPNCQVRFTYFDGNAWAWYVGLDNVEIYAKAEKDLSVTSLLKPQNNCTLDSSAVAVSIINLGTTAITSSFNITLDINNGMQVITETVNNSINSNQTLNYTFSQKADFSAIGIYNMKIYTSLASDTLFHNDTLLSTIRHNTSYALPYFDDFENSSQLWTFSGTNSSWEIGTPNNTTINSAISGTKILATDLDGNYNNIEVSYATSPCFDLSSDTVAPIISFSINHETESRYDSLVLQFQDDSTTEWTTIPFNNNVSEWYNEIEGFSGNSGGWLSKRILLTPLKLRTYAKFRFKFQSDPGTTYEGIGIDNFKIKFQDKYDLKLNAINLPSINNVCITNNSKIEFDIINIGNNSTDTVYLNYQLNNQPKIVDTIVATFTSSQQFKLYSLNSILFQPGVNTLNAWIHMKNDSLLNNDSIVNYVFNHTPNSQYIASYPYIENFDSFTASKSNPSVPSSLKNGWTRDSTIYRWEVELDPYSSTNNHSALNKYMVTNRITPTIIPGDIGVLTSPCIQLNQDTNVIVEVELSRSIVNNNSMLYIDFYNGKNWIVLDTIDQNFHLNNSWNLLKYKVKVYGGSQAKIKFRGVNGDTPNSDNSIDNLSIYSDSDIDLEITRFDSPFSDCDLSSNEIISVTVKNVGDSVVPANTSFLTYTLNGGQSHSEIIPVTLQPNDSALITFSQTADLSTPGSNNLFKVFASTNADGNKLNDTLYTSILNYMHQSDYSMNFDSINSPNCQGQYSHLYFENLPTGWEDLNKTWYVQDFTKCGSNSGTSTSNTGPTISYSGNNFIYFDATKATLNNNTLNTTCFDFTSDSAITLEFMYHKYGSDMGDLYIEVVDFNGNISLVDSIIGETHLTGSAQWLLKTINLDNFSGQQFHINFKAQINLNQGDKGDIAIDDFQLYNPLITSMNVINHKRNTFTLYPNPNTGSFNLEVNADMIGMNYQVFDIRGALVKEARILNEHSNIKLNEVEKGIYFLKIDGHSTTEKVVIY